MWLWKRKLLLVPLAAVAAASAYRGFSKYVNATYRKEGDEESLSPITILKEDVESVLHRDPSSRSFLEVAILYPGVHAIVTYRIANWLWRSEYKFVARLMMRVVRLLTLIEIHPGATIQRRLFIDHGAGCVFGETAEIGNDVTIYHQVTLGGTTWNSGKRHPTLEDNVIVGAGAKVLGNIVVGKGSRIGSNAVVLSDVRAGATVVGVPGRLLDSKARFLVARSVGFDVHDMKKAMPDPMAKIINRVLDHLSLVDKRQMEMCDVINILMAVTPREILEKNGIDACSIRPLIEAQQFDHVISSDLKGEASLSDADETAASPSTTTTV